MTESDDAATSAGREEEFTEVGVARAALLYLSHRKLPPTPENYLRAWNIVDARASADAVTLAEDSAGHALEPAAPNPNRLAEELARMVGALCDFLGSVADDESWVSGQIEAVRKLLDGELDRAAIADLRVLLADTAARQKQIREQRRATIALLKRTLSEMTGVIADLSSSTGNFAGRMAEHASNIEKAPSLEALGDIVRGLLEDTRAMHSSVEISREGLARSRGAADSLEQELQRLEQELANASAEMLTDHLTRTMNRRGLEEIFEKVRAQAVSRGAPLAIALIDVDDFKRLNDAFGHKVGDEALRHLADLLRSKLRPGDSIARYGGEEFVLLLPEVTLANAVAAVERLQRALTEHVFLHGEKRAFITFSGGVTEVSETDSLSAAIVRADEAMYRAKREGKNRVRSA